MNTTPPDCKCHDTEMRWVRDGRYTAGGYWYCRVRDNDQQRARYDADPIYRITKLEKHARRRRLGRLAAALAQPKEVRLGEV